MYKVKKALPMINSEDSHDVQQKSKLPKLSRFKLVAIVTIVLLSSVLIAWSCLQSDYVFSSSNSICTTPVDPHIHVMATNDGSNDKLRFAHMKRRLPQCIIIGARKAGTRALLTFLNIHPDIVTQGDEMHFFDDDSFYNHSLEAYRKKMPQSYVHQITVEKTPAYFTEPVVPERVYRMNNTIKLLLVLRDPVERTISDYLQIAEGKRLKNKTFPELYEKILDRNRINKSYRGISRSVYFRHLKRWLEFFPLSQIHIVEAEDLVNDPYEEMRQVEEFLGLEHKIKEDNFYFNESKGFYCIKVSTVQKCLGESKGRTHPYVDPDIVKRLQEYFQPFNHKLFRMIGRTFDWS